jgi:xylose dehydrogenase (NAD/NADP)
MRAGKLHWGILGCAGIAERALIPAIREARNAELAGIAARDPERAADWARRHGIGRSFPGYAELVEDPGIDAVYIPLANHLHAEWSVLAARAGKHVLCEKPLALNEAEVRTMFAAAEAAKVVLMEAFMYRFHPLFERTLELVRAGAVGDVRTVRSAFSFMNAHGPDDYRWNPDAGGGALYDLGCYPISAARTIAGREPDAVLARARLHPSNGTDLGTSILLAFGGGPLALLDCAFDVPFQSWLETAGSEARLSLDRAFSAKSFDVRIAIVRGAATESLDIPAANAYTRMVEHFGRAVSGAEPLRYGREDAIGTARVIDAAFASARAGRPSVLENEG